jgi:hypothetical protein
MADTVEQILLQLVLQNDEYIKRLQESREESELVTKQLQRANLELQNMEAAGQTASVAYKNLKDQALGYEIQLKALNTQQSNYSQILQKNELVNRAQAGSIDQMKAAVTSLGRQYATFSAELKATDPDAIKMHEDLSILNAEINKQQLAFGNSTANIGKYKQDIDNSTISINGLNEYLVILKSKLSDLSVGSTEFKALQTEIQEVNSKIGLATSRFDEFGNRIAKNETKQTFHELQLAAQGVAGAMTLVNLITADGKDKSEAERKAIEGIAYIMAIENTIRGAGAAIKLGQNAISKLRILALAEETTATGAAVVATEAETLATGQLAIVQQAAIIPTISLATAIELLTGPLGIAIIALGALFAAYEILKPDELGARINTLSDAVKGENEAHKETIKQLKAEGDIRIAEAENALTLAKARGAGEKELLQLQKDVIQERINANIKEGADMKTHYEYLLAQQKEYEALALTDLSEAQRKKNEEDLKANREAVAAIIAQGAELVAARKKLQNDLIVADLDAAKKAHEEELKVSEELHAAKTAAIKEGLAKENQVALDNYNKQLDQIKSRSAQANELRIAYHDEYLAKIKENQQKHDAEELKKAEEKEASRLSIEDKYIKERDKLAVKYAATKADQLAAELQQITDNSALELAHLELDEKKEIADATKKGEDISEIQKFYTNKKLGVIQDSANATAEIVAKSHEEELKEEVQFAKDKEVAAGTLDAVLTAKLLQLDGERKLELDANTKSLKSTEDKAKAQKVLNDKYNKLELIATQETERAKLQAAADTLGQAAVLFKKDTGAFKILATSQALISTYLAATKALEANAIVPFPGYAELQAGIIIAAGLENVAKINGITFYQGGYTGNGNPRSESTALGRKPYTYHKEEYVVPHQVLRNPMGFEMVRNLEAMRLNMPAYTGGFRGFAGGGFTGAANFTYVTQQNSDSIYNQVNFENSMFRLIQSMPSPIVTVEDINMGQSRVQTVASRANVFGN